MSTKKNANLLLLGLFFSLMISSCTKKRGCPPDSESVSHIVTNVQQFTESAEVHVLGVNGPKRRILCDDPLIEVNISNRDTAFILVMTAYDKAIWNLEFRDELSRDYLKGIIIYGHHCQSLSWIPDNVPILIHSGLEAPTPMPRSYESYGPEYDELANNIRSLTGLEFTSFKGIYETKEFILD